MTRFSGVWIVMFLIASLQLASHVGSAGPAQDPNTGRIRVFYLGDAWGLLSPTQHFARDPKFVLTPVPASSAHLGGLPDYTRYLRVYMPRTYEYLISSQDVIILSDTVKHIYTLKQLDWFRDSVVNDGKGIVMVGGREIQTGEWFDTAVEEALPVKWIPRATYEKPFKAFPAKIVSAFLDSIPWDSMPLYYGMNLATVKEGARLLLEADVENYPVLIYWEVGQGSGLVHTPDWTPAWVGAVWNWPYYADMVSNMIYLVTRARIPPDPALMHDIREEYYQYSIQWGIVTGMQDFVDMFGANTKRLEEELSDIDELRRDASRIYLEQDYDTVLEMIKEARSRLDGAMGLAQDLKDRALLWIYVTEASAVTGTSMICGLTVWLLMVKKRLYREVSTTRFDV